MLRVHSTKDFFPAFGVHRCQLAHKFVARFPFRILARADSSRKKRRDNPHGNVCRAHEINKEAKPSATTQQNEISSLQNRAEPRLNKRVNLTFLMRG
jgi:hypothetical protein